MKKTILAAAFAALAGCMTPPIADPLVDADLEARLTGQNLALVPDFPELGTPVNIKLFEDRRVEITYPDGEIETFRWRVEGQGLCFSGRIDPNEYFCRNVLVSANSARVTVYDANSFDATRIAVGQISPL